MLPSLDNYLHAKNLTGWLISSRDIDNQRIMQSNWLKAFSAITEEPDFSQIRRSCLTTKNTAAMHNFTAKKDTSVD